MAVPPQVRSEGLAERVGDLILQCSNYNPGAVISGNFALSLPVSITNRIDTNNITTDAVLSVDYGLGFTTVPVNGLINSNTISFNGAGLTVPANGNFNLKFSGVRADVHQLAGANPEPVLASLSVPLQVNQSQITVAYAMPGLFATLYTSGVSCAGSPLPAALDLPDLFAAKTAFFSTRITKGFGSAFTPQAAGETNGTRFLVSYTSFPGNSRLFVPNMVAGSDAVTPTAGGDLGAQQAVGQYLPGSRTLLLVLVTGADSSGAGGTPLAVPTGSSPVALNGVTEIPLTSGSGYAVYEVADANPSLIESAQFPTFVGLSNVTAPAVAQESISLAPVSTVVTASSTAPIPRFAATTPASDCNVVGDCGAAYFPKLSVVEQPLAFTAMAGGASMNQPGYIYVQNAGGGIMNWTASIHYLSGSGWLVLDQSANQNSGTIRADAQPQNLTPGTYQANVVIDAGPLAGNASIPVTLTVQSLSHPSAPPVTVTSIVNAATFANTPLVAGSLATAMGSGFGGKSVALSLNGVSANLLYSSAGQINFQVPAALASANTANLIVTVDGSSSAPATVQLAPAWPAVFTHGVLDQSYQENTAATPESAGNVLQIFAIGIPSGASVTAQIGSRTGLVPLYAGAAPTVPGVQQVNLMIPPDLAPQSTQLVLCVAAGGQKYCSPAYPLYID
ncbi:MAG: hypothetical protein JO323_14385 [Acidobacteriia bacterium]|nr:hypothetical protein [Terriglobia bacterium]